MFLNDCIAAHPIAVQEINDRHEVVLRAADKAIGVQGTEPNSGGPLELQDYTARPSQVFALDGDSIILVAKRSLVVQAQSARGAIDSPLVLAARNLTDSEFWDFDALDGSGTGPTTGFQRVTTRDELLAAINNLNALARLNGDAAWAMASRS